MKSQTTQSYYPTRSRDEYRRKYPNASVILDLEQRFLCLPASRWGKEHIVACRLIQLAGGKILPILEALAPEPGSLEHHEEWTNIKRVIDGPSKADFSYKSRWELERENGSLGTLWSTLAKCIAPLEVGNAREHPQRKRQPIQREEFTSSQHIQTSSSPLEEAVLAAQRGSSTPSRSSQQSFELASFYGGEVDEDEHDDRTKSEVLSVNLAGAFIRYVLNFCASQNPANKTMLEFREAPTRVRYELSSLRIDATDDGGIWVVAMRQQGKSPWVWKRRVALLEAKKAFQRIDDNNRPVVSDANLSQYTCEALTACLDNPDQNEVFVVAMTQTFMRILHFHRTEEYMQYLHCDDVEQQRASDAYLYMTETDFFALDSKDGRRHALCNLLGLVKFFEMERAQEIEHLKGISDEEEIEDDEDDELPLWLNDDDISNDALEDSNEGDSEMSIDNSIDKDNILRPAKRMRKFS